MRPGLHLAALLAGGILMVIQLSGCTIIGTVAGAASSTKPKTISAWELAEVKSGQRVRLTMKNDSTIETKYRGVYTRLDPQYAPAYASWVQENPDRQAYPDFRSKVVVTPATGGSITGFFDGLDVDRVNVWKEDGAKAVKFSDVLSMSGPSSASLTGARLAADVSENGAPLRRHFWFDDGAGTHAVDPRDVREVFVYGNDYAATGLLAGLAVDLVIVAIFAATFDPLGGSDLSFDFGE